MKRVLITGMSGTGKSTLVDELRRLGYRAVDADLDEYSHFVAVPVEELTGHAPGWDWVWREDRMSELLEAEECAVLFVAGCSPNQGEFYPRFDRIVLLTASPDVVIGRLATRTTNPYGKDPKEVARTLELQRTIEPLLRRRADLVIDTSLPLDEVVGRVLELTNAIA